MKIRTSKIAAVILTLTLILSPAADAYAASKTTQKATAQKEPLLSMSFPGAQLGYILQKIGKVYNANFSISSAASAEILTLEFKDALFSDVLAMIEQSARVKISQYKPGYYLVKTLDEDLEREGRGASEKAKEIREAEMRISNGLMKTFVLNYVGASDVTNSLNKLLGESAKSVFSIAVIGSGGSSGASEGGGELTSSQRREYSTIIVYAANQNIMNYITKVIQEMDSPKPMVEVQAVFVEISSNKDRDVGVNWEIMPNPIKWAESAIGKVDVGEIDSPTSVFRKTSLGQMRRTSGAEANATVQLSETQGRGRVLSNPKIRVMSGHVAAFTSETQVPILNKDSDGEINTEYKNVGIKLDVLPIVLQNEQIYLTVKPRVSSITDTVKLGDTEAPQIAERSTETTVLMKDSETMVIGGLLSDRDIKTMTKIPVLWKIPLFGELFKSEGKSKEHSSISVYISLRLIKDYMRDVPKVDIPDESVNNLLNGNIPQPQTPIKQITPAAPTADITGAQDESQASKPQSSFADEINKVLAERAARREAAKQEQEQEKTSPPVKQLKQEPVEVEKPAEEAVKKDSTDSAKGNVKTEKPDSSKEPEKSGVKQKDDSSVKEKKNPEPENEDPGDKPAGDALDYMY